MGPLDHVVAIGDVLDDLAVPWVLGGSLASSLLGEPRSTNDVDIAIQMAPSQVERFVAAVEADYYVPIDDLKSAADSQGSTNLIHNQVGFKVDLFFLGDSLLDQRQIDRREQVAIPGLKRQIWVTSAPDVVLRKLWWFQLGGGASDRQWSDISHVLRVQGPRIDLEQLRQDAAKIGLIELLQQALDERG